MKKSTPMPKAGDGPFSSHTEVGKMNSANTVPNRNGDMKTPSMRIGSA